MNSHLAPKIPSFCVANLRNSLLLRAIRRLESVHFGCNLLRPELIRGSLIVFVVGPGGIDGLAGVDADVHATEHGVECPQTEQHVFLV